MCQSSSRAATCPEVARVVCRSRHSQCSRAALRKALGDDTRPPTYIETVVRPGYRFTVAVRFDSGDDKPFAPDEAFDCLDQAIAYRDPALVHLAVAPDWDSRRDEPILVSKSNAQRCGSSDCASPPWRC